jgi:acetoin utilization deacetylase AcuC-like enzyme
MSERVLVLYDEKMIDHVNGPGHPERPDRLRAIVRELERSPLEALHWKRPRPATTEELRRVHSIPHVDRIDMVRGKTCRLDMDTGVSAGSVDAAYLAAGAACEVVEALMSGDEKRAFALVRPPGHHAERDKIMGFCLFNNIAIAAEHAIAALGAERVMIVDWDVHHCNGTQHSFYDRRDVLVISSHRYPFYPGTGWLDETGGGEGTGYTVNIPVPAGVGDETVDVLFRSLLPPIAESYQPDLVLVSAGFDAHLHDPLGGLRMSEAGFASLCGLAREVADRYARGRLGLFLEGGYDLDALARSTRACLQVQAGERPPRVDSHGEAITQRLLSQMIEAHAPFWPAIHKS